MSDHDQEFSLRLPDGPDREPTPEEQVYLDDRGLTVGYDLGVTVCEAESFEHADQIRRDIQRGAVDRSQPRGPRLTAYFRELLTHWPEVSNSDLIDSPYIDAPSEQTSGPLVWMSYNRNSPMQMQDDAVSLGFRHGLYVAVPGDARFLTRPLDMHSDRQEDPSLLEHLIRSYPTTFEQLGRPWYLRDAQSAPELQGALIANTAERTEFFAALLRAGGIDDTLTWRTFNDIIGLLAEQSHGQYDRGQPLPGTPGSADQLELRRPWSAIAVDWGVFIGEAYRRKYPQLRWEAGSNEGPHRSWHLPELVNLPVGAAIEGDRFRVVSMALFNAELAAKSGSGLVASAPRWWEEEDDLLADHRRIRR